MQTTLISPKEREACCLSACATARYCVALPIALLLQVDSLRLRLLEDGVGVVALPNLGAIRIAYSSTSVDDIPALVAAIARQMGSVAV